MKNHITYTTVPAPDGGLLVRESWPGGGNAYSVSKERVDTWKKDHNQFLTPQEQAYEFVTGTFVKLLQQDKNISYEHKRSVLAFYEDMFAHEGVRNNMLQAFSNFMEEIDKRMNASRKAGIVQARDALLLELEGSLYPELAPAQIEVIIENLLNSENAEEETIPVSENMDLSEVGGGDEDDTPLL